jgi:hypothetical protein
MRERLCSGLRAMSYELNIAGPKAPFIGWAACCLTQSSWLEAHCSQLLLSDRSRLERNFHQFAIPSYNKLDLGAGHLQGDLISVEVLTEIIIERDNDIILL